MKKIFTTISVILFGIHSLLAGLGCIPDTSNHQFFTPRPDSLPCIERTVGYNQVIQIAVPISIDLQTLFPQIPFPYTLYVDSLIIDSVTGLPNGILYALTPFNGRFYPGDHGCALVYGTTTDTTGNYPLTFHGTITLHGIPIPGIFDGDTTIKLQVIQANPQTPFHASVDVINPGDTCRPALSGIRDFNSALNSVLSVYPNPNNGICELKLNAGRRIDGEIAVVDVTGRTVYTRQLEVTGLYETSIDLSKFGKGLYTLQLRTADGFAFRNISIE